MEGEPEIERWYWDFRPDGNVAHIARNGVSIADVEEVAALAPRYFAGRRNPEGLLMLGPNRQGRYLAVAIYPSFEPGEWVVATAYWLNRERAERLYGGGNG